MGINITRRGRGTGTVRPRGKNKWQIRYLGLPDENGKRKHIAETVHGSRSQAERILSERTGQVASASYVPRIGDTVAGFLREWLDTYAITNTSFRTQQGYRGNIVRWYPKTRQLAKRESSS